ncbi:MAG: hypothetical protein EOP85_01035 [Verrucomicrobiaceae bacterium]|nr:MAG: hypothetical protein EOP85_01035 [Verrucomicrobiaceae bacterium]
MTAAHTFSSFHHWLLEGPCPSPARTIVLHGAPAAVAEDLVPRISEYLNEYDADGAGGWLAVTQELLAHVSRSPDLRILLGMADPCPNCPPAGPCGIRKTQTAIGLRGHVVLHAVTHSGKAPELPNAFHAGIGTGPEKCHVVLDPELMDPSALAHIIGDVFLEWLHCGPHSVPAWHAMRQDMRGLPQDTRRPAR